MATNGGFLWMQGISWLTREVWASRGGFYSIELVNNLSVICSVIFSGDEVLHMFVWTTDQRKFLCLDMKRMKNRMFLHIFRWVLDVCYVEGLHEMNLFDHFLSQFWCYFHPSQYSRTPLICFAYYLDQLGPSCQFVKNFTKLTCLEITSYQIKYHTVLWLLELQIRCGREV